MKRTENLPAGQVLGVPVLVGLGVTLLLMAAGSLLVLSGNADTAQIPMLAFGCLGFGCLCASFLAAAELCAADWSGALRQGCSCLRAC